MKFKEETGIDVSHNTIAHTLKEAGYKVEKKKKKLKLCRAYKRSCLAWAKAHANWIIAD